MGLDATPPAGPSALDATLLRARNALPISPLTRGALGLALRDVSAELYDGHACRVAAAQSRRAEHADQEQQHHHQHHQQQHGTNSSARSSREHGDGAHD